MTAVESEGPQARAITVLGPAALLWLLWVLPAMGQIDHYGGPPGIALAAVLMAPLMVGAVSAVQAPALQRVRRPLLIVIGLLILAFALLYPVAAQHLLGRGSDRGDALDVTGQALLSARPMYQTLTYLGEPPDPLPGAVVLALPFHLLGSAGLQNLLWAPLFVIVAFRVIGDRVAAAVLVIALVLLSPGAMQEYVTGGDYLINGFYVAAALVLLLGWSAEAPIWRLLAASVFFALAVSSRPIFVVELPVAVIALWRGQGWRRAALAAGAIALALAAIDLPALLSDPAHFPLMNKAGKLWFYPKWLQARWTIPALAMAVAAGASLRWATSLPRVFAISAASLAVLVVPSAVAIVVYAGARAKGRLVLDPTYVLPVSLYAGLWLFSVLATWKRDRAAAAQPVA